MTTNHLAELMRHKRWIDGAYLSLASSMELVSKPKLQRELLYWLNHIHIVDQIFYCHLTGKPHRYVSTVSEVIPQLRDLHEAMINLDEALITLAEGQTSNLSSELISFDFTDGDSGQMSRGQMLLHLSTHGLYHIAVTGAHLKQRGIAIPPMLLTTLLHSS